jgi:beta-lactamase superfamily II metal-dependent hydrolase
MLLTGPPPRPDELELSLFGCGVGESAVLHLGGGDWAIIDSCRAERTGVPLPLTYLVDSGIDLAEQVKLVVLTHWHDDHVDGASQIVRACPAARIACSAAFAGDEFLQLLGLYASRRRLVDRQTSGVRELGSVFGILQDRIETGARRNSAHAPVRTQADQILYRSESCQLVALAPSHGSIHVAHRELALMVDDLLSTPSQARVISKPARNDYSIALWVRWGAVRMLLGGDLEATPDEGRGWGAVLRCQQFPDGKAHVVKVAHHGSPNGDEPRIWEHIIADDPVAALTSYSAGARPRPSPEDLERLRERTARVYVTSLPRAHARRDRSVEKAIAGVVRRRRIIGRSCGHIRIRWPAGVAQPNVQIGGTAQQAV